MSLLEISVPNKDLFAAQSCAILIASKKQNDGSTLAVVDVTAPSGGRRWGNFRKIHLVTIAPGAKYLNTRSKGVCRLKSFEYDSRSAKQFAEAMDVAERFFSAS